jgi:hypothetical protein
MMPFAALRMRRAGATIPYLDLISVAPKSVLSLRKQISTATVSIRVRRSSDNAEQDIGFVGGNLDTASLATFVGSNSAYVTTFYDQTGGGFNAVQATAANQPRIVNAGTIDGSLIFDGANDALRITSLTLGTPQFQVYTKALIPSAVNGSIFIEASASWDSGQAAVVYGSTSVIWVGSSNAPTTNNRTQNFPRPTVMSQMTWLFDRSIVGQYEEVMYTNGVFQAATSSGATEQTGNYSTNNINIGARNNGASFPLAANIETLVFYNADTSGVRTSIEALVA